MTKGKLLDRLVQIDEEYGRNPLMDKYEVVWQDGVKYYLREKKDGKAYLLKYDDPKVEVVIPLDELQESTKEKCSE